MKKFLLPIILIILFNLVVFSPAFQGCFINMDDWALILVNPDVQKISLKNLEKIFTSFYIGSYNPLPMFSFAIEYAFFKDNPLPYHTTNVVLHELNCLLVFWLVLVLGETPWLAFLVALLFGIHPLKVESVAWVTGRKDLLYALFFLGALISYGYYVKRGDKKYYYWSLILFILAAFSKVQAIVLPLVLFLVDFLLRRPWGKMMLFDKLGFFAGAFFFALVGFEAQRSGGIIPRSVVAGFWDRPLVGGYLLFFYFKKIFWPVKLSCWYVELLPSWRNFSFLQSHFFLPLVVVVLILAIFFRYRKNRPLMFGSLFFLVTILPVLKPINLLGEVTAADRYTYIPLLGGAYLVALGIQAVYQKLKAGGGRCGRFFLILVATISAGLGVLTLEQTRLWNNSIRLWSEVIKNYPDTAMAYLFRAKAFLIVADYPKSLEDINCLLALRPDLDEAYYLRGLVFRMMKQYNQAVASYSEALQLNPKRTAAYLERGMSYLSLNKVTPAISDFNQVIEMQPASGQAYYYLAEAYYQRKEFSRLRPLVEKALQLGYPIKPMELEKLKKCLPQK